MAKRKLPALLVTSPHDQVYLTGFDGEDGAVLVTPRAVYLLTDRRFGEAADTNAPWAHKVLRRRSIAHEVAKIAKRRRLARIAIQPEHVSVDVQRALRKTLTGIATRTGARGIVSDLRLCKDDHEIAVIRTAIDIAQRAFTTTRRWIKPGRTERQIAAYLDYQMRRLGADASSFPTIVAVDANGSLPHHRPSDRPVKPGSAILIDWGARLDGYCSDLTRVLFVGRIAPRLGRVYQVVLDAQVKAIRAAGPTMRADRVDAVARKRITEAGYGERFGHGLGHGLGLDIHEQPTVSKRSQAQLSAGMVFTVEPGIYLPGVGGIRIEDDVLVTPDGIQVLSTLTKTLQDMVL